MRVGRWAAWVTCRRRWYLYAVLATLCVLALRVPRAAHLSANLPHHEPAAVAHFLADFSNHPKLYSHITGLWKIDEESSNYTSWSYTVSYECGQRCAGRVEIVASGGVRGDPQHGAHSHHRVLARDRRCAHAPLLPWPVVCEYSETQTIIKPRVGGGTHLEEEAHVSCSVLTALLSGCDVSAARHAHLRVLQEQLALAKDR